MTEDAGSEGRVAGARPAPVRVALVPAIVALVFIETGTAIASGLAGGTSFGQAVSSFAVTNLAICVSFGLCGAVLAWFRPRHPVGWLLALSGCAQGATGVAGIALAVGSSQHWPETSMLVFATVFSWAWPWSIGLGFLLALFLFPDGKLPSRRWRPLALGIAVVGVLFVLSSGLDPASSNFDGAHPTAHWGSVGGYERASWLWATVGVLNLLSLIAALFSLVVRYRRGDDRTRRQLLWVVLAVVGIVIVAVPVVALQSGPVLLLLVVALLPAAILVAILRHNLLDIRLVVSRTFAWALLTGILVAAYLAVVSLLGTFLADTGSAVVAAGVVALGMNPLRLRLQLVLDRLFYGDRGDPLRVLRRVGPTLASADDLTSLAAAIGESLQLPFIALRAQGRELVAIGKVPAVLHCVPLLVGSEQVGELVVGRRSGDARFTGADADVLRLLTAPVAIAVHATLLADELKLSRGRVVAARDDERRRLRRDLHDGLGPVLTGVGFKADAARNYVRVQPDEAIELLTELRAETASALEDVRRLVYDLRPPVLDDVGLLEALRRLADRMGRRSDGPALVITVDLPESLPELPAGVETAAYRIVTEALTNVVRHSRASWATVQMTVDGSLHLSVVNEGAAQGRAWTPGVGLSSMQERAAELGGVLAAGPGDRGGEVSATMPLDQGAAR